MLPSISKTKSLTEPEISRRILSWGLAAVSADIDLCIHQQKLLAIPDGLAPAAVLQFKHAHENLLAWIAEQVQATARKAER